MGVRKLARQNFDPNYLWELLYAIQALNRNLPVWMVDDLMTVELIWK
jgi:hypothetical protein